MNQFYVEAKQIYENQMKGVISSIADTVGRELTKAKDRISQGRKEIADYVKGLDPALKSVGNAAAKEIGSQFDSLEESVNEKSQSLAEDLAEKYVAARDVVDDEIKAMQEENKGLWSKAKDAIGGAIETILKLKNMLMGVLARAAGAISKIIKDPIGFLGNFVNAVKTGVMNFGSNILTHLKKGLQSWLFGTLAEAGIEIPEKFDLKGIVGLILSMLGLTWASIRARLAKVLPEWVLKALETAVEVVKILSTEGVSGLWKWIVQEDRGPERTGHESDQGLRDHQGDHCRHHLADLPAQPGGSLHQGLQDDLRRGDVVRRQRRADERLRQLRPRFGRVDRQWRGGQGRRPDRERPSAKQSRW